MIRVAIADDEPLARQGLRHLLDAEPDVRVVGDYVNGDRVIQAVRRYRPDLLFLDIQMPGVGGFGVLERLAPEKVPLIVFVTAYDEYAVRAFDVNAVDYLLKPFDRDRLRRALQRARQALHDLPALGTRPPSPTTGAPPSLRDRISIREGPRLWFLRTREIDWLEARGNYVRVWSAESSHLIRETLTAIEEQLDPAEFLRVSRSAIVNLSRVKEFRAKGGGRYDIILASGERLESSRRLGAGIARIFRS